MAKTESGSPTTPQWKATKHSFTRRDNSNDYRGGRRAYMLTLTIEEDKPLLGTISGDLTHYSPTAPLHWYSEKGEPSQLRGPHVILTALGQAILDSWLQIGSRYDGMISINPDECVVMPEHFHGIIYVRQDSEKHLSDFEKAFKGCCHTAYRLLLAEGRTAPVGTAKDWLAALQAAPAQAQAAMRAWLQRAYARSRYSSTDSRYSSTDSRYSSTDSRYSSTWSKNTEGPEKTGDIGAPPIRISKKGERSDKGFLFRPNYNDKHASSHVKHEEKREYIRTNPRTRLMRLTNRDRQTVKRQTIDTGLSLSALYGYLRSQCGPQATAERLAALGKQLMVRYSSTWSKNTIHLDSYGDQGIAQSAALLPVVCHRKDKPLFQKQKGYLLTEARTHSATLVSARIAKGEQEIIDEATAEGHRVIRILLEGFPDRYHPSAEINERCANGQTLLVSPWIWSYRYSGDTIDAVLCKTLNCIAQSICHRKDDIWKG